MPLSEQTEIYTKQTRECAVFREYFDPGVRTKTCEMRNYDSNDRDGTQICCAADSGTVSEL